jgi:hypothetical protein
MEMLSLYDYLGKPAGSDLGKQVADAAAAEKIRIDIKYVSNPKYKGNILMYPKDWLDKYFQVSQVDDLPF